MFLTILNLSGSSPITGLTLSATGLYFFLVERLMEGTSGSEWPDESLEIVGVVGELMIVERIGD
jgi:hypothetical protein